MKNNIVFYNRQLYFFSIKPIYDFHISISYMKSIPPNIISNISINNINL